MCGAKEKNDNSIHEVVMHSGLIHCRQILVCLELATHVPIKHPLPGHTNVFIVNYTL